MSFGFVRPLYDDNRDVHVYNYNREYQLVVLLLEKPLVETSEYVL